MKVLAKEAHMTVGIVIVLFVALVGLGAVGTAIRFAVRPTERGLSVLRPLSAATTFAALCACLLGIATALVNVVAKLEAAADPAATAAAWRTFLAGLAEGIVPLGVASALLSVAWLLAAVGLRKQA
jgi:hypothetical protein